MCGWDSAGIFIAVLVTSDEVVYVQAHAIIRGEHRHAAALLWLAPAHSCSLAIGPRQMVNTQVAYSGAQIIGTKIRENFVRIKQNV